MSPLAQAIIQKQFDEARAILSQFPTQAKESLPFIDCTFHGYGDWAASYILKQLIECQKTPLNPSLIQGPSPLMLAIRGGSLDLVDKLLKEGADPNLGYLTVTGQKSHTPGLEAVHTAEILWETPMSLAIKTKNWDMVNRLVQCSALLPSIPQFEAEMKITAKGYRGGRDNAHFICTGYDYEYRFLPKITVKGFFFQSRTTYSSPKDTEDV